MTQSLIFTFPLEVQRAYELLTYAFLNTWYYFVSGSYPCSRFPNRKERFGNCMADREEIQIPKRNFLSGILEDWESQLTQ
jgi:hypothetical protein